MPALSNAYAKEISALKLKKYRQSYRKFIIEGPNLIEEALSQDKYAIESIIGTRSYFDSLELNIPAQIDVFQVSERELKKISSLKTPYGALAVLKMNTDQARINSDILFYLDGIQDPGNLGAIIRSADWFGMNQLLLGEGTVDLYNPKTLRASMGSIFRLDGIESNYDQLTQLKEDYQIVAADMEGINLDTFDLPVKTIVIIGNEGRGIQEKLRTLAKSSISIPQFGQKNVDSLNAAISSSIIMYALKIKKPAN